MNAVENDEYTYKDCCCYQCCSFTPHNNPDCACDSGPLEDGTLCPGCPKAAWCEISKGLKP